MLQILAFQAAIALENSLVFEKLESLVDERTAELVQAKDLAETANRAKSDFLSGMSHELRTPLNAILGYATILKRRVEHRGPLVDGLDIISQSGAHLLTLINDVLDLAKIEAGKLELHPAPVNLPTFLRQVTGIMRARAEAKELSLTYEALSPLPYHRADRRDASAASLAQPAGQRGQVHRPGACGPDGRDH